MKKIFQIGKEKKLIGEDDDDDELGWTWIPSTTWLSMDKKKMKKDGGWMKKKGEFGNRNKFFFIINLIKPFIKFWKTIFFIIMIYKML
jgi:hypothetical protein